jgi:hypothetical protein
MNRDNIDDASAFVAALRAEVAAQRELLERVRDADDRRRHLSRLESEGCLVLYDEHSEAEGARDEAIRAIRTHLAGAAPKPQEPVDTRRFPVLNQQHCRPSERLAMPRDVPWAFAERFRAQAERNHGQTLERLAERGGLSPQEMWLAAHGRRLIMRDIDERAAIDWLAGAAVPAAEGHVFGVGDVVRVVGNSEGNPSGEHDFAIGSEAVVRGRPDGRLIAVRGVDRPTLFQDVLVHDLVLVRKAGAK